MLDKLHKMVKKIIFILKVNNLLLTLLQGINLAIMRSPSEILNTTFG